MKHLFQATKVGSKEKVVGQLLQNKLATYIITEDNPHECTVCGYIEITEYTRVKPETVRPLKPVYKNKTMKTLIEKIRLGESYFGSGGHVTPQFNSFFLQFKKELNKKLVNIDGFHSLEVSKGHFYISGFFSIKDQAYYFSISDVRWNMREAERMLVRTAKHYKDYTGGPNNYVSLDTLDTDIIKTFRL